MPLKFVKIKEEIPVGKTAPVSDRRFKFTWDKHPVMHGCPTNAINLIDSLSVLETLSLLKLSKCLITMDSGLLHLGFATDISIVGMFTVDPPFFRKAWRNGSFDYKFEPVAPVGDCYYCAYCNHKKIHDFSKCPFGAIPKCIPSVEDVYNAFNYLMSDNKTNINSKKGVSMQNEQVDNIGMFRQQAIQSKLDMYEAKQTFESKLNIFCDNFNNLINNVSALRKQNVELEVELQRERQRNQIFDKKEKTESK